MADLKDNQKEYIVQMHGYFYTPSEIQAEVKKQFNVSMTIPAILYYDPTSKQSKGLAQKWVDQFESDRREFLSNTHTQPLANASFRLRELSNMYRENTRNTGLRLNLLDQAGKEDDRIEKRRQRGFISMFAVTMLLEEHGLELAAAVNECIDDPELQAKLLDAVEARWNKITIDPKRLPDE